MKDISFGIIGTGEICRIMLPAFKEFPGLKVVAVADINESAAQEVANNLSGKIEVYENFRTLLANPQVEAVYIATPPFLHKEMILESLAAGKHILCEKPVFMSLEECLEVRSEAQLYPNLKVAGCSSRFHAAAPVRRAREIVLSGELGKLMRLRLQVGVPLPSPLSAFASWRQKRATNGGGLAVDWGVYDLDWINFLIGDAFAPVEIFASTTNWEREESDVESGFVAQLVCESGLIITWERFPEHGPQFQKGEIRGTTGGLDLPFSPGGVPADLQRHHYEAPKSLKSDGASEPMLDWGRILYHPLSDFVEAIQKNSPVASPLDTQVKINAVIDGLYASAKSGKSVSIALN